MRYDRERHANERETVLALAKADRDACVQRLVGELEQLRAQHRAAAERWTAERDALLAQHAADKEAAEARARDEREAQRGVQVQLNGSTFQRWGSRMVEHGCKMRFPPQTQKARTIWGTSICLFREKNVGKISNFSHHSTI